MPRYRIQFAREKQARFVAHLDLARAFERAIRRAELPIAFSQGYNPHPKMSFAAPIPVGITGREEYVDIEMKYPYSMLELAKNLAASLPEGLRLKKVKRVPKRAPALMAVVGRADYTARGKLVKKISNKEFNRMIASFLEQEEIYVKRQRKQKEIIIDIRPGIFLFKGNITDETGEVFLKMGLKTGSEGSVRPEEVLDAFFSHVFLPLNNDGFIIERTALYAKREGDWVSLWDY